jgi:glycosyltransferase involved in cell wall biosynthesis
MRLVFVVDGRSPIALNWIAYFCQQGHEVHLVSTYPCDARLPFASLSVVTVAFSNLAGSRPASASKTRQAGLRQVVPVNLRTAIRQWFGLVTLPRAASRLQAIVEKIQPDLVHAMRIPYEGMIAAGAGISSPLLVSVWGNDFTLHAVANRWMGNWTKKVLTRADAIHADCQRDILLAGEWGFPSSRPSIVLPGGGGIHLENFYPPQNPPGGVVINPRGVRAYIRNDSFFQAVQRVVQARPEVRVICPAMAQEASMGDWVRELGIADFVRLLPQLTSQEMADQYRQAQVVVSPSTHDGTPNTLLEALACGCFPIAGDLESLREWITPGVNGLLVDPGNPHELADAILQALDQDELRQRAQEINRELIASRADYRRVMPQAETFYKTLVS